MKTKTLVFSLFVILLFSCQAEADEMDKYDTLTDTFLLVDYYGGMYKFVQINNLYTIGVDEGILDIPEDFIEFESEEMHAYYTVELKLTGIGRDNTVKYQRYTRESNYYLVRQAGRYTSIHCYVQRVPFFNDYLYYIAG
ncbi:MAG: hypothetical protein LUG98_05450 [Tannerellaceae bacterium]|nr:hypothetical protein [Tannerellaceae bacterium]